MSGEYLLKNIFLLYDGKWQKGVVGVENGRISGCFLDKAGINTASKKKVKKINCRGKMLLPGMIDIHIHGTSTIDSINIDERTVEKLERVLLKKGVTGFLPTFYSIPFLQLRKNLVFYREYIRKRKGRTSILGVNLEGPFLNKNQSGAHDKKMLTEFPDSKYKDLISEFRDIIRVITVSPELKQAMRHIKLFSSWKIKVMIGHSRATFNESECAVSAGACGITHFYNRTTPFHHREVGITGTAFLNDSVYVELIADSLHSSREALKIALNNIDNKRVIMISDMIAVPDSGKLVKGINGCRGYADGKGMFVGGGSHLINCIKNVVKTVDMDISAVWDFVSCNPASFLGISKNYGGIKKGMKADMVIVNNKLKIQSVIKSGEIICVA